MKSLAQPRSSGSPRKQRVGLAQVLQIPAKAIISFAQGGDLDGQVQEDWLVATAWGISQVQGTELIWQRPWTDAMSARSIPHQGVIEIVWSDGGQSALKLTDPKRRRRRGLALVLKEQIQHSILLSENFVLPPDVAVGKQVVWVAVRRDEFGKLFSEVIGPQGLDLEDPRINTRIANIESRLRTMCGLCE